MASFVLFDCDGVLINSEEIAFEAERDLIASYGLEYSAEEYVELFSGISSEAMLEKLNGDYRAAHGKDLPEDFPQKLSNSYKELLKTDLEVYDGVFELITNLKRAGVPFAIGSNSEQDSLERKLKQVGLYDLFAPHVYSKDLVEDPKPAPDLYLFAAGQLEVDDMSDGIVVEDSVTGTHAGIAAGMEVVGFFGGDHKPESFGRHLINAGAFAAHKDMRKVQQEIFDKLGIPVPSAPRPGHSGGAPKPPSPQ